MTSRLQPDEVHQISRSHTKLPIRNFFDTGKKNGTKDFIYLFISGGEKFPCLLPLKAPSPNCLNNAYQKNLLHSQNSERAFKKYALNVNCGELSIASSSLSHWLLFLCGGGGGGGFNLEVVKLHGQ